MAQVYHWQQYSADKYYPGTLKYENQINAVDGDTSYSNIYYTFSAYVYRNVSINQTTGQITLSNRMDCSVAGSESKMFYGPSGGREYDLYFPSPDKLSWAYADGQAGLTLASCYACKSLTVRANLSRASVVAQNVSAIADYRKGTLLNPDVTSTNIYQYPSDGRVESYWYVKTSTVTETYGNYIEQVYSYNPSAYPNNGKVGSYWYVYAGEES